MKIMVIVGTARLDGNTWKSVHYLNRNINDYGVEVIVDTVDLSNLNMKPFMYSKVGEPDGFIDVVKCMAENDVLVFATPVYWYSMSTIMKMFFDRLTDLLLIESYRPLRKALKGRSTYLMANGEDPGLPEGFVVPFRNTSQYLHMKYCDAAYLEYKGSIASKGNDNIIKKLCDSIVMGRNI